ncbi:DNA repair protein rad9 [Tricharina praecox]|uniref:DNA repair protein rad9 n=1 Tax=Tricharina praecox TaxID=43433 RepID=UPI002220C98D|nr:DNA repair protein rad9 [Tricharina praecox]KAI5854045.1 DNA repair protein rad9 [Tricharina praecox]
MTTLSFTLSPQSTQHLHETLSCLSKFSDQISLEARRHQLCVSALNSTKSAYAAFHLSADRFFTEYTYIPPPNTRRDAAAGDRFTFRLQAKALLAVFRLREAKDKGTNISKCEVRLCLDPARLAVRMWCHHGALKMYKLTFEEVDIQHAIFDRASAPQRWRISAALLKEYMEHFGPRAEQLDISSSISTGRAAFTSFTEKLIDGKEILKQPLQTSVALDTADFEEFVVADGLHIAVSLKDFKAITAHAASLEVAVEAWYDKPGRPMQIAYVRDGMEVLFTLMTAADVRSSQNFAAMGRIVAVQRERQRPPTQEEQWEHERQQSQQQQSQQQQQQSQQQQQQSQQQQPQSEHTTQPQETPSHSNIHHSIHTNDSVPPENSTNYQASTPPSMIKPEPVTPGAGVAAEVPLFLNFSEDDDDDDDILSNNLDNELGSVSLGWDTQVARLAPRTRPTIDDDEEEEQEEDEEGVGPTQQSAPPPRGLFD